MVSIPGMVKRLPLPAVFSKSFKRFSSLFCCFLMRARVRFWSLRISPSIRFSEGLLQSSYCALVCFIGFDHGVGHPLLLLYDAKAPNCRKNKVLKGLGHYSEWPKVADAVIKAVLSGFLSVLLAGLLPHKTRRAF